MRSQPSIKNSQGFIMPAALAAYILILVFLTIALFPLINTRLFVSNHMSYLQDYYNRQAALARTVSLLQRNISYSLSRDFSDLNQGIELNELDASIAHDTHTKKNRIAFDVFSETSVLIDIKTKATCFIEMYDPSGELIFHQRIKGNASFVFDDIYHSRSDTWGYKYGTYEVKASGATITVSYPRTVERIIGINNKFYYVVRVSPGSSNNTIVLEKVTKEGDNIGRAFKNNKYSSPGHANRGRNH